MMHRLDLTQSGLPLGWALVFGGSIVTWLANHGLLILGVISICSGVACHVVTAWAAVRKVQLEEAKARREIERASQIREDV